jgi:site-specific recombinase XerC
LTDDELVRFLAAVRDRQHANNARDRALFALLANTGFRPSEVLVLTRGDLHLEGTAPWVRVRRLKKRKAIPEREEIEISTRLAEILAAHAGPLAATDRVFRINRRAVQRLFKFYARRAGLWKGHHLYVLRHTAATRMYVATRDLTLVQAMLGHENVDTSCIYAHLPFALLVETVNAVPAHV